MIFCSLVIVGVLSKRRGRALRTPTTPRPASASASAMTPTVGLSLNYCNPQPPTPPLHLHPRDLLHSLHGHVPIAVTSSPRGVPLDGGLGGQLHGSDCAP